MDSLKGVVQINRVGQLRGTLTPNNYNMAGILETARVISVSPAQKKEVFSSLKLQKVVPDIGLQISEVDIYPLPVTRIPNEQGGTTVIIGDN